MIAWATFVAADGVDEDGQALEPKFGEKIDGEADDFSIDHWVGAAEDFAAELVKLAITACLWLVVTEHWPDVVELHRQRLGEELVFDEGAHGAGCAFWAQGDVAQAFVFEGIHFFRNDVGCFTDAAQKQLGVFENWGTDLFIMIVREKFADQSLEILPFFYLAGQKIVGSSRFCC